MQRRYLPISIILLAIITGFAFIFLFTGITLRSGSNPVTVDPEQPGGIIPARSPVLTPTAVTMNTSIKSVSTATPPPTVATGDGAVYPYPITLTGLEQRVHDLINQQRAREGLGSLSFDPALAGIARNHSEDMAAQHYFAHMNPGGQDPTARGTAAGYSCRKNYGLYYTYGIAENLFLNNLYSSATFYSNRETVYHWNSPEAIAQITVAGWMNSTGHRENILTPAFDREGIGIAIASEKVYITENFC